MSELSAGNEVVQQVAEQMSAYVAWMQWSLWDLPVLAVALDPDPDEFRDAVTACGLAYIAIRAFDDVIDQHFTYKGRRDTLLGTVSATYADTQQARGLSTLAGLLLCFEGLGRLASRGDRRRDAHRRARLAPAGRDRGDDGVHPRAAVVRRGLRADGAAEERRLLAGAVLRRRPGARLPALPVPGALLRGRPVPERRRGLRRRRPARTAQPARAARQRQRQLQAGRRSAAVGRDRPDRGDARRPGARSGDGGRGPRRHRAGRRRVEAGRPARRRAGRGALRGRRAATTDAGGRRRPRALPVLRARRT